jgi:hypothetical protein
MAGHPRYPACGQHPPPAAAHAEALAQLEAQAGPDNDFPMAIPPMTDMIFSVAREPQEGQGMVLSRSPVTSSS